MGDNIIFVGLDYGFVGDVANNYSLSCSKFFMDVQKYIEYSIQSGRNVIETCGLEYFERQRQKAIFAITQFEDIVINFPHELILNDEYYNIIKKCKIIFLDIDKEILQILNQEKKEVNNLDVNLMVYDELKKLLSKRANLVIKVNKTDINSILPSIIKKIEKLQH